MKKVKISYEKFYCIDSMQLRSSHANDGAFSKRNHGDMKMLESDRGIFVICMSHSIDMTCLVDSILNLTNYLLKPVFNLVSLVLNNLLDLTHGLLNLTSWSILSLGFRCCSWCLSCCWCTEILEIVNLSMN